MTIKYFLLSLVFISCFYPTNAQEKIKGNKNVTTQEKTVQAFHTIKLGEKFEVQLIQSNENAVSIETDENLHEIIVYAVTDSVLSFHTLAKIKSKKELKINISTSNTLQNIQLLENATLRSVNTIKNDTLNISISDKAKIDLKVNNQYLSLINNNNSSLGLGAKSKLNIQSKKVNFQLSENSKTDAWIQTDSLNLKLLDKSYAKLEGEVNNTQISLLQSSDLFAKNLTINSCDIKTDEKANATINTLNTIEIEATGDSEINLYGDPDIHIKAFRNTASLQKKEL